MLQVSHDIIPLGEFKAGIAKWLKKIKITGQPLVITQNGKPAGVLLSPQEYDELVESRLFIESVERGLRDGEEGRMLSTGDLREELKKRRGD